MEKDKQIMLESLNKLLESLKDMDAHLSTDWIMKDVLGVDPLLYERKMKIDKILNGKRS